MFSRLAHLKDPEAVLMGGRGAGGRVWGGNARVITPFPTRTVQLHKQPQQRDYPRVTEAAGNGDDFRPAYYAAPVPADVRPSNASGFVSSPLPFQSYFRVHWEDLAGLRANLEEGTRKLAPLYNPNAKGAAEGQPIQGYNPWPSASQLAPQYPGGELKAI